MHALSLQVKDEELGAQGQQDNRGESWKPKCIVRSPIKDRISVKRSIWDGRDGT